MVFKESEAVTLIVKKEWADRSRLEYSFVAAWITLTVHSSLADTRDLDRAMDILRGL